jgi:glycosyltransferase involved in cell wall biosynthesis
MPLSNQHHLDIAGLHGNVKVVVAQKGAREHFLAARALHRRGSLACLLVDWYAPKGGLGKLVGFVAQRLGAKGRAAMAAKANEIPDALVKVNWINGLMGKWRQRVGRFKSSSQDRNLVADIAFTKAVSRTRLPHHNVFFGYSYMSLEMLEIERRQGVLTILDQIDPGPVEFRLVAEEMDKYRQLAGPAPVYPAAYYERLRREWDLADVIVVNSEWSRDALISEGVPAEKIEILPLSYEGEPVREEGIAKPSDQNSGKALSVLWLGQVNVRKGIHYLIEAARMLEGRDIHFDIVGPIGIACEALESAPSNMTFHGSVSRDLAVDYYRKADVFVLPTLSDGFAITQLEAMAYGLPVITTPHCGKVVTEGETGFVVPARNAKALAEAVMRFDDDRSLSARMRGNCRASVKKFSIDAYAKELMQIINRRCKVHL